MEHAHGTELTGSEESAKDPALAVSHGPLGLPELLEDCSTATPTSGVSSVSIVLIIRRPQSKEDTPISILNIHLNIVRI